MFELYEQWQSSGLNIKTFSKQHAIAPSTFYYWVKKFKDDNQRAKGIVSKQGFSELSIPRPIPLSDQKALAVIHFPCGTRLEFHYPVEAGFIKTLIQ